jgi:methionyl-tRNA formyltransferase
VVACTKGAVSLLELQLDGKKRMDAAAFLAGFAVARGACFATRSQLLGSNP